MQTIVDKGSKATLWGSFWRNVPLLCSIWRGKGGCVGAEKGAFFGLFAGVRGMNGLALFRYF